MPVGKVQPEVVVDVTVVLAPMLSAAAAALDRGSALFAEISIRLDEVTVLKA